MKNQVMMERFILFIYAKERLGLDVEQPGINLRIKPY
jgi:hypothetical protein